VMELPNKGEQVLREWVTAETTHCHVVPAQRGAFARSTVIREGMHN